MHNNFTPIYLVNFIDVCDSLFSLGYLLESNAINVIKVVSSGTTVVEIEALGGINTYPIVNGDVSHENKTTLSVCKCWQK